MKKVFALIITMILLLTACSANAENVVSGRFQNARTRLLDKVTSEESIKINQMSNDIIKSFTEKDKELLKSLFCEQVRSNPGFDKEIDNAFEFLICDVYTTSTIKETASGGSYMEQGKRIEWYIAPEIPYFSILTEIESEPDPRRYEHERYYYSMSYYWQITYEADNTLEGLHYLVIELLNVDKLIIGEKTSITNYNPFGYFEG